MNDSLKRLTLCSLLCCFTGLFAQSTGGLNVIPGNNINASQSKSNKVSVSIAVDPTDAQKVFFISDDDNKHQSNLHGPPSRLMAAAGWQRRSELPVYSMESSPWHCPDSRDDR
ncbi:MAG: hypothetical protein QF886_07685 [Planctomycetota bacterium]|jgi:hypothetical protein|nr:hypothetical protein [Planctomycetota bacterium]